MQRPHPRRAWLRTTLLAPMAVSTMRAGLAGVVANLAAQAPALAAPEPGATAPDFELDGPAGRVQLSKLQGKLVYLDFWASWCGPCRQSFPWMNDVQARLGPRGLQVLGVNLDARSADADKFLAETPARFQVAFDPKGDTPKRYGVKGMPTSVLIGPDGRVLLTHSGFRPDDKAELEARITDALNRMAATGGRSAT
ncbi:TlpA family protein disulfide reductase [Ideonella margarita]|uniref:TlpA disulfide reductase family protein n=1 Tax=Ideonella margarita TaxID=2984191 RepID=A0ABU9C7G2_9BURK